MFFRSPVRDSRRQIEVLVIIALMLLSVTNNVWSVSAQKGTVLSSTARVTALSPIAALSLTEWTVPSSGAAPWGIGLDSSGKIWFTENASGKLGRFDPTSNDFTEWSIPGGGSPRYVFVSDINMTRVCFTEYSSNKIGFLNTSNNTFVRWQLPAGSNPVGIFVDENNDIWFTESGRDVIGRLRPSTGQLTEWTLPGATGSPSSPLLRPWGLYVRVPPLAGGNRFVWFTELESNKIGRLEANSGRLAIWDLNTLAVTPGIRYGPMDLTADSANNVIFSSIYANRISILGSNGTVYSEYNIPTLDARPMSVRSDSVRNAIWFTEYNASNIATANTTSATQRFLAPTPSLSSLSPVSTSLISNATTVTSQSNVQVPTVTMNIPIFQGPLGGVTEYRLPTPVSRPNSLVLDQGGNVWFTESNATINKIARLSIPYVFQLSASPNTQTVSQGQSASYSVSVNLLGGNPLPAQLSLNNASSNLTVDFTPQSGTPPFTSTLTIATTNSTPTGVYAMDVMVTSGGQSKSSAITLTVQSLPPPSFDFGMNIIGADTATAPQGESASFEIEVTLISGSSQRVNLTASGFPAGTTHSFTTLGEYAPFTTRLYIQTGIDTPPGSYPITITGTSSEGITHHQTPILQITEVNRDFSLTAATNEVTLVQASRTDLTLIVTSIGPFNGNITLNGAFSPSAPGLTVTFLPSWVAPSPNGGTSQAIAQIVATRNTPGQIYQLTVTGTSDTPSRTHEIVLTVRVSPCLIATAAFGSELAPEVQFLRTFRDQQVMRTFAGSSFMAVFNSWYYSFSPAVAQFEYSHATVRMMLRALLYPLIGILHLSSSSYAILNSPEMGVLTAGIVASLLIGQVYVALPAACLLWIARKRPRVRIRNAVKLAGATFLTSIVAFFVAESLTLTWLMMMASAAVVLIVLGTTGILGVVVALQYAKQRL